MIDLSPLPKRQRADGRWEAVPVSPIPGYYLSNPLVPTLDDSECSLDEWNKKIDALLVAYHLEEEPPNA